MDTTTDPATPRMTPPRWLNWLMSVMLRTPGLQRLVGRRTALVTVVGRTTGRLITTPISFTPIDGRIVLTSHATRQWWRNLRPDPTLWMRIAGEEHLGTAHIVRGEEALPYFVGVLEDQPMMAKMNRIDIDDDGRPNLDQAAAALEFTVVVVVDIETPALVGAR